MGGINRESAKVHRKEAYLDGLEREWRRLGGPKILAMPEEDRHDFWAKVKERAKGPRK